MIKTYYLLTKPGIVLGNIITTAGGFALASKGHFDYMLFLYTLVGLFLVMASACAFNNYLDRHIDKKMERTKNRAFAKGLISGKNAIIFAALLVLLGIAILAKHTNSVTVSIALIGFFVYVVLYSLLKKRTTYATVIGSIAGATPPAVGYCAAAGRFDLAAFLLFMILVFWQMPHFFAISIFRFDDYKRAGIPVLPVVKGIYVTKIHMLLYILAFICATLLLTVFGYAGYAFSALGAFLGLAWAWLGIRGFKVENDARWARQMFALSIAVITVLSSSLYIF